MNLNFFFGQRYEFKFECMSMHKNFLYFVVSVLVLQQVVARIIGVGD